MAANLIDEIKAAEEKAANSIREAEANAAKRLNQAAASAENSVKEAKQAAAKQFRENIQTAEKRAEEKARGIVSARETASSTFYTQNKEKVSKAAAWITEEVTARYGRG
jgi:vacuolar-type H+-ATPase subunit H